MFRQNPTTSSVHRKPSSRRPKLKSTSRTIFDVVKEGLSATKDGLDVALKLASFALVLPGGTLYAYLHEIGWAEIFSESIASIPGLLTLLGCSILLFYALLAQFFLPSVLFWLTGEMFKDLPGDKDVISNSAARTYWLSSVSWGVVLTAGLIVDDIYHLGWLTSGWIVGIAFAAAATTAVICSFRGRHVLIDKSKLTGKLSLAGNIVRISALPAFVGFATVFPLFTLLWVFGGTQLSLEVADAVLLACCVFSLLGLIPGVAYLHSTVRGHARRHKLVAVGSLTAGLSFLVVLLAAFFAPVKSVVLAAAGVNDVRVHVYQLLRPELAYGMRAAHLPVADVRGRSYGDKPPAAFVGAYLRYNLGGIKLLCRNPYKQATALRVNNGPNVSAGASEQSNTAGKWCFRAKSEDLAPVRQG
nr:hypothetical protein HUO10_005418 [Paraburkholderia busanensis]